MWLSIVIILCCLLFSALFSGLNLGLMSMDETGLKIISNTGALSISMHVYYILENYRNIIFADY